MAALSLLSARLEALIAATPALGLTRGNRSDQRLKASAEQTQRCHIYIFIYIHIHIHVYMYIWQR